MDTIKDIITIVLGASLVVSGKGRTYAKVPLWLAVLIGLSCMPLTIVTALLVVAMGMRVQIDRA